MSWFRSWHGAPTDNKWLVIAKRASVKPIHVSGTWWALLDHASQHSVRGTVDDFDVETFALFAGMEETHVSRIVTALCEKGLIVDGKIAQWGKRQPKREDETAGERKRRQRNKNGGKPPNDGGDDTPDHNAESDGHAMSRNVTIDRTDKNRTDYSDANASGTVVPHPAADFCKAVFDSGKAILIASGRSAREAGSIVGRWRKTCGDADLLTILRQAEIEAVSDPVEWVTAAVETRNGSRGQFVRAGGQSRTRMDGKPQSTRFARYQRICAAAEAEAQHGDFADHHGTGFTLPPLLGDFAGRS